MRKPVSELYVMCSFPMVPGAVAASDTCRKPASSGVIDPDGRIWWRCCEHEGWCNPDIDGAVVEEVVVRDGG